MKKYLVILFALFALFAVKASAQYSLETASAAELVSPVLLTNGSNVVTSGSFSNTQNLKQGLLVVNATKVGGTATFTLLQSGTTISFSAAPASYAFTSLTGTGLSFTVGSTGVTIIPINMQALNQYVELTATTTGTCTYDASLIYVPQDH
jgi:hypothetical protein